VKTEPHPHHAAPAAAGPGQDGWSDLRKQVSHLLHLIVACFSFDVDDDDLIGVG
jgi:hypothetical protein